MNDLISPKYLMKLIKSVETAIWEECHSYREVMFYISKWHICNDYNNNWENFAIAQKNNNEIDLLQTLHNMDGELILKVAIDIGIETPDFIPSIPTFRNEIKAEVKTAYNTFTKAFKQIETDPSIAIGLANSALESIIKEILKDQRLKSKVTGNETLYKLSCIIIKEFNLNNSANPKETKTIGNSLITICQAIETLRSEKTDFHGKTADDYLIKDSIYAYFILNAVSTVGLFLQSFYKSEFPKTVVLNEEEPEELPF
jgi:hypothetical protein